MPPSKHAVLSASKCYQWGPGGCHPSARINASLPDGPASPYAAEGTHAHALCEALLRSGLDRWPQGEAEEMPAHWNEYPSEMQRAAEDYCDVIRELWSEFPEEPGTFIEQRVNLSRWIPEGFGACDCLMIGSGTLCIVDFKYGAGVPVSADHNSQMMCYALGAYQMFSCLEEIERVQMIIVQPRVRSEPDIFEMPLAALLDWGENQLKPAAQMAWEGKGELNPSEKTCKFCKAYPSCRAWAEKYGPLAGFTPCDPALMSDAEVGEWLQKFQGFTKYEADLEEYATKRMEAGAEIPGFKLVEGRSTRQWKDQDAAFSHLTECGTPEAVLYDRKPASLTAIEKALGKKRFGELCADYVVKPPGAPKLAPESDKRPVYNPLDGFTAEPQKKGK